MGAPHLTQTNLYLNCSLMWLTYLPCPCCKFFQPGVSQDYESMVLLIICLHLQPPQTPQPPGRRADHLWRRRGWQKRQPSKMPFNQSVTMATATTGPEVPCVCVCVSYVQALLLFSFRGDGCHAQCGCLYILYCMSCPQYFHSSSFFFFLCQSPKGHSGNRVCVYFSVVL